MIMLLLKFGIVLPKIANYIKHYSEKTKHYGQF